MGGGRVVRVFCEGFYWVLGKFLVYWFLLVLYFFCMSCKVVCCCYYKFYGIMWVYVILRMF